MPKMKINIMVKKIKNSWYYLEKVIKDFTNRVKNHNHNHNPTESLKENIATVEFNRMALGDDKNNKNSRNIVHDNNFR